MNYRVCALNFPHWNFVENGALTMKIHRTVAIITDLGVPTLRLLILKNSINCFSPQF